MLCSEDHDKGKDAERLKRWESCEDAEELKYDACPVQFSRLKDPPHIKAPRRNVIEAYIESNGTSWKTDLSLRGHTVPTRPQIRSRFSQRSSMAAGRCRSHCLATATAWHESHPQCAEFGESNHAGIWTTPASRNSVVIWAPSSEDKTEIVSSQM